ncbi:hypothetical protein NVV37_24540, partial [Escherichia coli]|nr:hypothetical protein [Escherichia coli]
NTIIANEGDIILPYMDEFNENTLNYLNKDYVMVAPRYVFNLNDKNQIFNYYDRNFYKDAPAAYVLKTFFTTGEMSCMNLGSIYRTKEILNKIQL